MNLLKILDKLSDDKFFTTETSRSGTFSQISEFGKKAAIASIPLGLGSLMATSAKAETAATSSAALAPASALTDALQLALTLEYLEDEYYARGLAQAGLITGADRIVFFFFLKHETAHVAF